ncbi:delta-60 repeat domain-containing protein [Microbacterium sp. Mcb102]|uniref:delta-60 repeat domain-containing protein n=1 Tax=Microbacterium sp. Mcb102 TaxID=2926012 RepID=UPI0021C92102|nr:delta-60 repeat domain-containing protein [Microbacterium sp. Mcb102]
MSLGNTQQKSSSRSRLSVAAIAALAVVGALFTPTAASAASPVTADLAPAAVSATSIGQTQETAAASCWEIKQTAPAAGSGVYWLNTPELGAPQQFYCDQVTDGGGWVLIGRGRENWLQGNVGRLTPKDVWENPTGPAAFSPAQLPTDTVTGLLNGGNVDALQEGVRLRRAQNVAGTTWQEVRFKYATPRAKWSWQFAGVQQVGTYSFNGETSSGGNTGSFGRDNTFRRVETNVGGGTRGWARGFQYGSSARGNPAADSYLWQADTSSPYPRPFTQVFLRPRLMSADIFATPIPDAGTPQKTVVATASSYAQLNSWGVSGLGAGGSGELNTEVSDFVEIAGVMYVGGNFKYVQRTAGGTGQVEQSYLAAFDVATGEWISTFRPVLNNQVKTLAALPDGRLAIGGAFNTVNGVSAPAFAVLNPSTGAVDPAVTTKIINYTGGTPPLLRTMDVQDGYLYIGGRFTHATGSGVTREVYMRNLGRLNLSTLAPDAWNPLLDGTVVSVDASARGDRVYAAGYFGLSNWETVTERGGAYNVSDGSVIPWSVLFSNRDNGRSGYQQAVREIGDKVWLGGSEHSLFSYSRDTMALDTANITQNGGDFQAINTWNDYLVAGCHCSENVYQGATTWPTPTNYHRVEHIDQAGFWNTADGSFSADFNPQITMRVGYGVWAIEQASNGSLWLGGDLTHVRQADATNRWTGAFARFAPRDAVAPTTPTGLTAARADGTDTLTWDAVDGASYEVLRNDRTIATTTDTRYSLPAAGQGTRYFVRSIDAAGNRSASTPVITPAVLAQPVDVLTAGANWSYWFAATAPAAGWQLPGADVSNWRTGAAPLGWGHSGLGTTLTIDGTKPVTSYYQRTFDVQDAAGVESLTLTTRADDGIIVYVNGTEVGRANMPAGAVGFTTYASSAPSAASAVANPVTFTVPGSLLQTGANTITAEVHSNYRTTPSASFELTGALTLGEQPEPEPVPVDVIGAQSQWSYYFGSDAPAAGWATDVFDASGWAVGTAPLGWGHTNLGTTLSVEGTRPLTSYFRKDFTVDDVSALGSFVITTRADDGIRVSVNGTEVSRVNLPAGTVGHTTYATAVPSAAQALANPVVVDVPLTLLRDGANNVSVEVHSNYRTTPSHSFELVATAVPAGAGDAQQRMRGETAPAPEVAPTEKPVDAPKADKKATTEEPSAPAPVVPPVEEAPAPVDETPAPTSTDVLTAKSVWSYHVGAEAPAPEWTTNVYDDSSWPTGTGSFLRGVEAPQDFAGTVLEDAGEASPITTYFRAKVDLNETAGTQSVTLTPQSSGGIVVYVNGTEVGRVNMPEGAITADTLALPADAAQKPVTVAIPLTVLADGADVITVEVHSVAAGQSRLSFDMTGVRLSAGT